MKNIALILASGTGSRFGADCPKQFVNIGSKCILQHTISVFQNHPKIDEIIVVTNEEYLETVKDLTKDFSKVKQVIKGGETRKDSSYNGIMAIPDNDGNVLIHDGVRPLVSDKIINDCISSLETKEAVCTAIDTTDTIYVTTEDNEIIDVPTRKTLKRAQTPQCFRLSLIKKAHKLSKGDNSFTDDCGMILKHNLCDISVIDGDINNIKITYQQDTHFAEEILKERKS